MRNPYTGKITNPQTKRPVNGLTFVTFQGEDSTMPDVELYFSYARLIGYLITGVKKPSGKTHRKLVVCEAKPRSRTTAKHINLIKTAPAGPDGPIVLPSEEQFKEEYTRDVLGMAIPNEALAKLMSTRISFYKDDGEVGDDREYSITNLKETLPSVRQDLYGLNIMWERESGERIAFIPRGETTSSAKAADDLASIMSNAPMAMGTMVMVKDIISDAINRNDPVNLPLAIRMIDVVIRATASGVSPLPSAILEISEDAEKRMEKTQASA